MIKSALCLLFIIGHITAQLDNRPEIKVKNGNLIFSPAHGKNITIETNGINSFVNFGRTNAFMILKRVQKYAQTIDRLNKNLLDSTVASDANVQSNILDDLLYNISVTTNPQITPENKPIKKLRKRLQNLEKTVIKIDDILLKNECSTNPCKNGATCIDGYDKFICLCNPSWEGPDCSLDVDECLLFEGTLFGCQNGGACINLPGSYSCACPTGFYGTQCQLTTSSCRSATNAMTCGHGLCVPQILGHVCVCDLGWRNDGVTQECLLDVDECSGDRHPCSAEPFVPCVNTPGSFKCGTCPEGYSGTGYYCTDINECLENNGGCSINPHVPCHNTIGSRVCGKCPPGYDGDGIACTYKGVCEVNNGGCHALATCYSNYAIGPNYVRCVCHNGYTGIGVGPSGCYPISSTSAPSLGNCYPNPCVHGACHDTIEGHICICEEGFTGLACDQARDPCVSHPCMNGGTCMANNISLEYKCECSPYFTGSRCQSQSTTPGCGGKIRLIEGEITYPENSTTYRPNTACAWVIETSPNKVLNVTITKFDLESSAHCDYDWLQIHDGKDSSHLLIGRYCGKSLPKGGNLVSTHNSLYLWFRSDRDRAHDGFALRWNSIDPICGGTVENSTYGIIRSPGSPGRYPSNSDCYWLVKVQPGKRIQFNFYTLQLENHPNCSFDFIQIFDGADTTHPALVKYCNTSHPSPLITPGPQAMLYFHSDDIAFDFGFQIAYSEVEGMPGCGGIFTNDVGVISSPSIEGKYPPNMECHYLISINRNVRLKLSFISLDLNGVNKQCEFDYLKIYDGDNVNSQLIGTFCMRKSLGDILSTGNKLLLVFHSYLEENPGGFSIKYEILCHEILSAESGTLTSPDYPKGYPSDRNCTYLIELPPKNIIVLDFIDFQIEGLHSTCAHDYLKIFDGFDSSSPQIGIYCDKRKPSRIISKMNGLFLEFFADTTVSGPGWKANYSSIALECGGTFKESNGLISFPDADDLYDNNMNCEWIISAPSDYNIQLTWTRFNLESAANCNNDYLEIFEYDSIKKTTEKLGRYCGAVNPPSLTSSSNEIRLVFKSDQSLLSEGFSVSYVTSEKAKVCGGNYITSSGTIRSPGWPLGYDVSQECIWTITARSGYQIKLNISSFGIWGPSGVDISCEYDYLEISAGDYSKAPIIGKYCNILSLPIIYSPSNMLKLRFVQTDAIGGNLFGTWESLTTECGGVLDGKSGTIISPNYPQGYGDDSECYWKIRTSPGSLIKLDFIDIDLEFQNSCDFDYVEIFNSEDTETKEIGRYCTMPKTILSESNNVFVKFKSDSSTSKRGFLLQYDSICDSNIVGFSGVIESFNYPNKYPEGLNCTWKIHVPRGNRINIIFTSFGVVSKIFRQGQNVSASTLKEYDVVKLKDGKDEDYHTSNTFYGTENPPSYTSSDNTAYINFVTTFEVHPFAMGFRIEWAIYGCGGHVKGPTGILDTSRVSQHGIITNTQCNWIIEVEEEKAIELSVIQYRVVNELVKSIDQSLVVYNGMSRQGPKLLEITMGALSNTVVTSSGNYIIVSIISNHIGLIFSANYTSVKSKCGGTFKGQKGTIHSPNYPDEYDLNSTCSYYITVPKDHRVELILDYFDLVISDKCNDYIKIYDGLSPLSSNLIRKFCPTTNTTESKFVLTSNKMLVEFVSREINATAKGFSATYFATCGTRIETESNGIISPDPGMWVDPDFAASCEWTIIGPTPGDRVSLRFTHMDLHNEPKNGSLCPDQFVKVFNGMSSTAPMIAELCGKKIPEQIYADGNALTISLSPIKIPGQLFTAYYSVLSNACGGDLTAEEGTIASPHFPHSYPAFSYCVWQLKPSPGNRIRISFSKFSLGTDNCEADYLEIREENGAGKLLGLFCGNTMPKTFTTSFKLWIQFQSDNGTGEGFVMSYIYEHGGEITNRTSGSIASPLYPSSYTGYGKFSWRIMVKFGQTIRIEIKKLRLQSNRGLCLDHLVIYDGYDDKSSTLVEICDNKFSDPIISKSSMVYIEFIKERIAGESLFLLDWNVIENVEEFDEPLKICGSNVTFFLDGMESPGLSKNITFSSPGFPREYDGNLNCTWTFETVPTKHLVLKFNTMSIEEEENCIMDKVSVYSGRKQGGQWTTIGDYCFANATIENIHTTKNWMLVNFFSDDFVSSSGFEASVYTACGSEMEEPMGILEITKMMLPSILHRAKMECIWKITVRPGRTIRLQFLEMIADNDTNCLNYLMVKNGISDESPILGKGKYCGNDLPDELETLSNHLYVKYSYNIAYKKKPEVVLKLVYNERSKEDKEHIFLSNEINSSLIMSPNYPQIPNPHSRYEWIIRGPIDERLKIEFLERFDLTNTDNCLEEYVEIRDGGSKQSDLIGRFCSHKMPPVQKTSGNQAYIEFFTDVTDPKNGFKAKISIETCGGTLYQRDEVIRSPMRTQVFTLPAKVECEWRVVTSEDHNIILNVDIAFPSTNLCENASIEIMNFIEYNNTEFPLSEKLCGQQKSLSFESMTNIVIIKMISSKKILMNTENNFKLTYNTSISVCGGALTDPEGSFDGFRLYQSTAISRNCRWTIDVPKGRRITVKIIQGKNDGTIKYFDGKSLKLQLEVVNNTVESSGNSMLIYQYIRRNSNMSEYIQYKATYSSYKPTVCGESELKGEGSILVPSGVTSFLCDYSYALAAERTLVLKFSNLQFDPSTQHEFRCALAPTVISIKSDNIYYTLGKICKTSYKPIIVLTPLPITYIKIEKNKYSMTYRLDYSVMKCGGIVYPIDISINIFSLPEINVEGPIYCSWLIRNPSGYAKISVSANDMNLTNNDCKKESFRLRTYYHLNPIKDWCDEAETKPYEIHSDEFVFEYYSDSYYKDTSLQLLIDTQKKPCGGRTTHFLPVLTSPNYPGSYPINQECLWELRTSSGFKIELVFYKRFAIEKSPNCSKDFVEILDKDHNKWVSKKKLCGRDLPDNFISTTNELNVLFRSDSTITNDGFMAMWFKICGGTYWASETIQYIKSPDIPRLLENVKCKYIIKNSHGNLIINFTIFDVGVPVSSCSEQSLTINDISARFDEKKIVENYCGPNTPGIKKFEGDVEILFQSKWGFNSRGFEFSYKIDNCGGIINSSQIINLVEPDRYNCIWNITAPNNSLISIRFRKFNMKGSYMCFYNYLNAYEGAEIEETKLLGSYCGDLNRHPPVFKSKTNQMILKLITRSKPTIQNFDFFGEIVFVKGCGKNLYINATTSYEFEIKDKYEEFLDCSWLVTVPIGMIVRLSFNHFGVAPCLNSNQTILKINNCTCDFFEIRDGNGPQSTLVGKYCGQNQLREIVSSGYQMWIRFVSDGTLSSSGIRASISTEYSLCGESILNANNSIQTLLPPMNAEGYVIRGIRCTWIMPSVRYQITRVKFSNINLSPPKRDLCINDHLEITTQLLAIRNSSNYESHIISAQSIMPDFYEDASVGFEDFPRYFRYVFCGQIQNFVTYIHSVSVKFTLETSSEIENKYTGFKIEYNIVGCSENYTAESGRLFYKSEDFKNVTCTNMITVEGNKTISIYFKSLRFEKKSFLTIKDGAFESSPTLVHFSGGYNIKLKPYFSNSNSMLIIFTFSSNELHEYEATYVSTDKGQGCGGFINDHKGIIYSPLYPLPYRGLSACEWIVKTPEESFVTLKFTEFYLGGPWSSCDEDYVELIDKYNRRITKFCPDDNPATYIGNNNYVKIVQHASSKNVGTGWVAVFTTRHYFEEMVKPEF